MRTCLLLCQAQIITLSVFVQRAEGKRTTYLIISFGNTLKGQFIFVSAFQRRTFVRVVHRCCVSLSAWRAYRVCVCVSSLWCEGCRVSSDLLTASFSDVPVKILKDQRLCSVIICVIRLFTRLCDRRGGNLLRGRFFFSCSLLGFASVSDSFVFFLVPEPRGHRALRLICCQCVCRPHRRDPGAVNPRELNMKTTVRHFKPKLQWERCKVYH